MQAPCIYSGPPDPPGRCYATWRWPSRLDLKQTVLDAVAAPLLNPGWVNPQDRQWLYLCLDEAVVNAMLHGNEGDPGLEIELALWADESRWVMLVKDQGHGFSGADIPDHEQPQSLYLEHGRGIRIMQEWLDELAYYHGGTCAWLARRRCDRAVG